MALSNSRLSTAFHSLFVSHFGAATDDAKLQQFCDDLASAVVTEITGHAVVNVTSVSGVTTGSGTSGSGLGTIT